MSNILFLFSHPDDEAFGPSGTIMQLANEGHEVTVSSMCNGARPGAVSVAEKRQAAFKKSCKLLSAKSMIGDFSDLTASYSDVVKYATQIVEKVKPDIVYTHNISDINNDHRLLADAALVACRPKPSSPVNELYFSEIAAEWTFGTINNQFEPNTFNDVTDKMQMKKNVIELYGTETYEFPDLRSWEAVEARAKYRGATVGFNYAEAFKLVFKRHLNKF